VAQLVHMPMERMICSVPDMVGNKMLESAITSKERKRVFADISWKELADVGRVARMRMESRTCKDWETASNAMLEIGKIWGDTDRRISSAVIVMGCFQSV